MKIRRFPPWLDIHLIFDFIGKVEIGTKNPTSTRTGVCEIELVE